MLQGSASDSRNFDHEMSLEKPKLSPVNKEVLESIEQSIFEGFSFTNENVWEVIIDL